MATRWKRYEVERLRAIEGYILYVTNMHLYMHANTISQGNNVMGAIQKTVLLNELTIAMDFWIEKNVPPINPNVGSNNPGAMPGSTAANQAGPNVPVVRPTVLNPPNDGLPQLPVVVSELGRNPPTQNPVQQANQAAQNQFQAQNPGSALQGQAKPPVYTSDFQAKGQQQYTNAQTGAQNAGNQLRNDFDNSVFKMPNAQAPQNQQSGGFMGQS